MILKYGTEGFNRDVPVVHKWVRRGGVRVYEKFDDFEPYFYIHRDVDIEALPPTLLPFVRRVEPTDILAIDGTSLSKVVTILPKHVPLIRDSFGKHYEADIPFTTRFMLDRLSLNDFGEPYKTMYLDIELGVPRGAGIAGAGEYPIICMSALYDGQLKEFLSTGDEEDLLYNFVQFFVDCDPDIIAGWNIGFDIRALIHRLGINARLLSPLGYVQPGEDGVFARDPDIPGRIIFDLYAAYKLLMVSSRDKPRNYSLNTVAGFEFGWEMPSWSKRILEIYEENPAHAMDYNVKHTRLCEMLDKKFSIVDTFTERQKTALCEFRDTMYDSVMFDRLLLRRSPWALPSKPKLELKKLAKNGKKKSDYTGATVFDPVPGLHHNVSLYDFRSLYPSAVMSLNISPETICPIEEADFKLEKIGTGFKAEPIGLMPSILKDLLDERASTKKLSRATGDAFDLKQKALKIVANAAYGAFGFTRFRLYNKDIARSITFVGRSVITAVKKYLESLGYIVIYGDTDSLFVKGITDPISMIDEINNFVSGWMKDNFGVSSSFIEIEFETQYESLFFGKEKKRYFGRAENSDKILVKGYEVKRRDCPKFGIDFQWDVMGAILDGKGEDEVIGIAKDAYARLTSGGYSFRDIGIPKRLSAPLATYERSASGNFKFAWAKALEDTNKEFKTSYTGQEDELLFVHTAHGIRAAIPEDFDNLKDAGIDYAHLASIGLYNRIRPFFDGMGWDIDPFKIWMKYGGKQKTIDSFW